MSPFSGRLRVATVVAFGSFAFSLSAAEFKVDVRCDFPGGNVLVVDNNGVEVRLKPDLRGGDPWFYWHFEAVASDPGKAMFTFPGSPIIGVNGPAVSVDGGKTWRWLGAEHVRYADPKLPPAERSESFEYSFNEEMRRVRFAVAIPYLPADLEAFLETVRGNPRIKRSVLTKTRLGTPVDLLEIGTPGQGRKAMLVTARHHACESMASYVLEGFVREAASDSAAGAAFRENYRLFVVPMVDRDGVAAGDQGKNRSPHDHNRDYGDAPIYPEVAAVQELAARHAIHYTLDLHCPALRGDVHEVFHFLGLGLPRVKNNIDEFIGWIREERPQTVGAPLSFLVDSKKPGAINRKISSHYFATSEGNVVAATLEIPYAVPQNPFDADTARDYGAALLRAWTATSFVAQETVVRGRGASYAALPELRTEFARTYRSKPDAMAALTDALPKVSPYVVEGHNLRAVLFLQAKRYAEAVAACDAALADGHATTLQKHTALLTRLRATTADPNAAEDLVRKRLDEFLAIPYLAREHQAQGLASVADYYEVRKDYLAAIESTKRQIGVAAGYDQGRLWLRIATLLDESGKQIEANTARTTAIEVLRKQLQPKPPRSGFGGAMTVDLFEAVSRLPSATQEEKRAAARLVLEHDVVPGATKDRVRRSLEALEPEKRE
jgi:tetratricopeptide (TPR) repeat protein